MSEEELTKAMEGLGMEEGDGEGNILPIMQSIMQNLLSKDVLYPSLKEITEKVCKFLFLPFLLTLHINLYGPLCSKPAE
jgi:peroxin-19